MEQRRASLFSNLLGKKTEAQEQKTPVVITSYSQPHVLQQRMHEEGLRHGDRVTANISPVRLEANFGKMVIYFCPTRGIELNRMLSNGDGGSLPCELILDGLEVPKNLGPGLYNLKNVELFSNGKLQVIATADTEFECV